MLDNSIPRWIGFGFDTEHNLRVRIVVKGVQSFAYAQVEERMLIERCEVGAIAILNAETKPAKMGELLAFWCTRGVNAREAEKLSDRDRARWQE